MASKQRLLVKLVNKMGKESALISIIVPVYNVEKWLDRCIQSLVDQTYQTLEIILIDDGSTDSSSIICDEWAQKDHRITVIHQENAGLSVARNLGVDSAHGKYISFVDSDDWIDSRFIEILHQIMIESPCDLAECGVFETFGDILEHSYEYTAEVNSKSEAMQAHLEDTRYTCVVWNKMYRRDIIRFMPFPNGRLHEDLFWTYQVINQCETLAHTRVPLYYHFHRKESITGSQYSPARITDLSEGGFQRLQFLIKYYPDLADMARVKYCLQNFWFIQLMMRQHMEKGNVCISQILNRIHSMGIGWLFQSSAARMKEKVWLSLFYFCPSLTCAPRNIMKIGI